MSVPGGVRLRVLVLLLLFRGRGILRGGSGVLRYRLRLRGAGNNRHLSNGGEQGVPALISGGVKAQVTGKAPEVAAPCGAFSRFPVLPYSFSCRFHFQTRAGPDKPSSVDVGDRGGGGP